MSSSDVGGPRSPRPPASRPAFPEDVLRVSPWVDPVLDKLGHDPRSGYVERFWLSILGPSCVLLIRRLAAELERQPKGFELDTVQWALELGIGMRGGRNGPFWRSIERACRFGAAQRNGDRLAVRRRLPPLTSRQVDRLPMELRTAHNEWSEARLQRPIRRTVTRWNPNHPDVPDIGSSDPGPEDAESESLDDRTFDDAA